MVTKINILGDCLSETGYANHTRQLAMALEKEGIDVSLETQAQPNWEQIAQIHGITELLKKNNKEHINIAISMPPVWPLVTCRHTPFYGFAVFEGTKAPIQWVLEAQKVGVDKVLVPSTHTKTSLTANGLEEDKIAVIPHGVDLELFKRVDKFDTQFAQLAKDRDKFTFIFVGGWSRGEKDRKNLPALLRAYSKEFKKDENVRLIVKLNTVYNDPRTWNLQVEMDKLKIDRENSAPIAIITDMIPQDKMNQVYSLGNVFVMPTRGEAFCLPSLEAMACGLPNITTMFGGQTDFVSLANGWLIGYKLKPACEEGILYEEAMWADINEEELRRSMRYAFEHPEDVKRKGKQAIKDAQKYSWKNSAKKLIKVLNG